MNENISAALQSLACKQKAISSARFFKTTPGHYGEGDIFIGITNPQLRDVAKTFHNLSRGDIEQLLACPIHEYRAVGLYILKSQFLKAKKNPVTRKELVDFYCAHLTGVNNWDLVDGSADIIGIYLVENSQDRIDMTKLLELARSESMWEQRIAIIATLPMIKKQLFEPTLMIAELLLSHRHDLIHKAVGWMLKEIGKRNRAVEESFLKNHYRTMPRTMLRYAIEKFAENIRQDYLAGRI